MFKKVLVLTLAFLFVPINTYALETPEISAECAVVIDAATKNVLYEKNAYLRHSMASVTKLMTCLIACESGKLNETVAVTDEMLINTEGTSLYLKAGDRLTLSDLVKGAMLESGNDAANAIAVYLDGSVKDFSDMMNAKANSIGMSATHFVTPSGLDAKGHYSCAYDIALLGAYCSENSVLCSISSSISDVIKINGKERGIYNHNKLLKRSKHFCGFKTGFTKKAGRCLVSMFNYSGSRIITVTLNAPDDWNDHIKLVRYVKHMYGAAENIRTVSIAAVGGQKEQVACSYSYKLKVLGNVYVKLYYYPFVYAPVKKGTPVGEARLYTGDYLIKTVKIITTEDI